MVPYKETWEETYMAVRAGSDEYDDAPDDLALFPESLLPLKPVWKQPRTVLIYAGNLLLFMLSVGLVAVSLVKGCSEQECAARTSNYCKIFREFLFGNRT
jgi:hypothetical protein